MKMFWTNKTGLAKAAIVLTAVFLVSAGLCGVNAALFSRYGGQVSGPEMPNGQSERSLALINTGLIELAGMAIGAGGLILVAIAAIGVAIQKKFNPPKSRD